MNFLFDSLGLAIKRGLAEETAARRQLILSMRSKSLRMKPAWESRPALSASW